MSQRQHLITLIETYAQARRLSPSRVATILFSSGAMYRRLVEGADITVGRLETAVAWLSANWPDGADWPDGIARPAVPQEAAPEGERFFRRAAAPASPACE